jgi:uncharacterized protein YaaQ
MKLILAIVRDTDADAITQGLTSTNLRVTRVASTGGLLRRGMTTLLIGLDENQVDNAIKIIRENCTQGDDMKRGALFVVPVERFEQI